MCRQSPVEKPAHRLSQRNRTHQILSYQIPEIVGACNVGLSKMQSPSDGNDMHSQSSDSRKIRSTSFSGSESSLPPIIAHKNDSQNIYNTINNSNNNNNHSINTDYQRKSDKGIGKKQTTITAEDMSKLSKFCHECGAKFVISQAKFCMECGVRRVALE